MAALIASSIAIRAVLGLNVLGDLLGNGLIACVWTMAWAMAFVGSLYVWKYDSPLTPEMRDQSEVILQRFTSVGVISLCLLILTPVEWKSLGFPSSIVQNVAGIVIGGLVLAILYLGPLTWAVLDHFKSSTASRAASATSSGDPNNHLSQGSSTNSNQAVDDDEDDEEAEEVYPFSKRPTLNLLFFRNVVYAPFVEELVFRSFLIPILLQAGFSNMFAICGTPIFFGLAHVHHILLSQSVEYVTLKLPSGPLRIRKVVLQTVFQATYTTLFGFIVSYLFVYTGTFLAPFIAHVFCNHMGFPRTDFMGRSKQNSTSHEDRGRPTMPSAFSHPFEPMLPLSSMSCYGKRPN